MRMQYRPFLSQSKARGRPGIIVSLLRPRSWKSSLRKRWAWRACLSRFRWARCMRLGRSEESRKLKGQTMLPAGGILPWETKRISTYKLELAMPTWKSFTYLRARWYPGRVAWIAWTLMITNRRQVSRMPWAESSLLMMIWDLARR